MVAVLHLLQWLPSRPVPTSRQTSLYPSQNNSHYPVLTSELEIDKNDGCIYHFTFLVAGDVMVPVLLPTSNGWNKKMREDISMGPVIPTQEAKLLATTIQAAIILLLKCLTTPFKKTLMKRTSRS